MQAHARVFVMFRSEGRGHEVDWADEDLQHVLTHEQILAELRGRCEGVEFVGTTAPIDPETAVADLDQAGRIDGAVVFGPVPDALARTGLPIVSVFRMWQTWMSGFQPGRDRRRKVLFDCVPMVRDRDPAVFAARMDNLARKIRIIRAIAGMKYRLLSITDASNFLGTYEPASDEQAERFRRTAAEVFGTEFATATLADLVDAIRRTDAREAERIADRWIRNAYGMKNTSRPQVIESAKVYLAMKHLRDRHGCEAVTTEGYGVFGHYPGGIIASQCLAATQLSMEGMITTGECLINAMLMQQLGYGMTGRGSFTGDYILDPFLGLVIIGHCECSLNVWGDDAATCSYTLRNMPLHEKEVGGACVQVNLPIEAPVTVVQMNLLDRQITVFSGRSVSGEDLFSQWNSPGVSCRTKLAIRSDTRALLEQYDRTRFSNHRVVFFGDYRHDVEDLATLLGFELIEEDKAP